MQKESPTHPLSYSVATSFDDELLHSFASLNKIQHQGGITEIFGAHRTNIAGGGRPAYRLPQVSAEVFERHVALANSLGLRFNYVMNAPDFRGQENQPRWLKSISDLVCYLADCGVKALTIAHRSLLELVKRDFEDFRVNLSLIAGVDSVDEAKRYEDMGVDVLNLNPFTINRDFKALDNIRHAVSCELELYANIPCLHRCPRRAEHYIRSGHASREGGETEVEHDSFLRKCSYTYLTQPVELLQSPFIRPEDVAAYREVGIDFIKLSDRTEKTPFLSETARAYVEERYAGNLFKLIFRGGSKIRAGLGALVPDIKTREVPIVIDNTALNRLGFIEHIRTLRGADLKAFYEMATREAVRFTDLKAIEEWILLLRAQEAS